MSCSARPARSDAAGRTGRPGEASGRQRLQARSPAACAAAADGRKRTDERSGVRAGQLGRQ